VRQENRDELCRGSAVVLIRLEPADTSLLTVEAKCPYIDLQSVHVAVMLSVCRAACLADVADSKFAIVDSPPFTFHPEQHR